MANNEWDRTIINTRERPVSSDINQLQSQADRTLRYLMEQLLVPRVSISDDRPDSPINGFVGGAFKVREDSPAGLQVVVSAGQGFQANASDTPSNIDGVPNLDDLGRYKPLVALSDVDLTVPTPDPTNPRIDIIEVSYFRRRADPATRDVLNTSTGAFDPTSVNKILAWNMEGSTSSVVTPADSTGAIGYKAGLPSATPALPPTTAGYIKIAEIAVAAGVSQIDQEDIKDMRLLLGWGGVRRVLAKAELDNGGSTVSLDVLKAPPGIVVAANISGSDQALYIFGGDLSTATPVVLAGSTATNNLIFTASIVTVDAALQTNLQTAADTDPTVDVAIGQSAIKIEMATDSVFTFDVAW